MEIVKSFENNKKYLAILETSKTLFWKHGFRRVSIEEICREAKTSKMTFYRFFPNKLELARRVLDWVIDDSLVKFREILSEDSTVSVKLEKILQMKLEGTNDISKEFLQDFYNDNETGLTPYIEERVKSTWREIIKDFKKGQEDGWVRKDMKVEFLFYFIQLVIPAFTDKELLKLYNSPQELIMEVTNLIVYGISPRE